MPIRNALALMSAIYFILVSVSFPENLIVVSKFLYVCQPAVSSITSAVHVLRFAVWKTSASGRR